jgi:hypothetical protein
MWIDTYQEHLDSQPDESRWDGFDRGDDGRREPEPSFLTFAQANAQAKALVAGGARKVSLRRIADGCFEVVCGDPLPEGPRFVGSLYGSTEPQILSPEEYRRWKRMKDLGLPV